MMKKAVHVGLCLLWVVMAIPTPLGLRWWYFMGIARLPEGYETAWLASCVLLGTLTVVSLFFSMMGLGCWGEKVWKQGNKP